MPRRRKVDVLELGALDENGNPVEAPDAEPKERRERRSTRSLGAIIRGQFEALNGVLSIFPALRDDALSDAEMEQATKALDNWQKSSGRVRKLIERTSEASGGVGVLLVGLAILLPRLQRHGVIPGPPQVPEAYQNGVTPAPYVFEPDAEQVG